MVHGVEPHWPIYILEQFFAEVIKCEVGLAPDLIEGAAGKIDTARLALAFDASRNIYAIAKDVVAVNDDVADIDADSKGDLWLCAIFPFVYLSLHSDGAGDCVHHAGEFHQYSIASSLDYTATMLRESGIDDFAAVRLQRL